MITVVPVASERQLQQFIDYPYQLYRNHRYWVPPIKKEQYKIFDPKHNPFWSHAERQFFLALHHQQVVGRICAIVDYNFIDFWKEKTGYFGFFECDQDQNAAKSLFNAVRSFLADKGMKTFIGPMNPSTNDECGLLIEGFFSPPFLMMTYNHEYYQILIAAAGLEKAKDLYAHFFDIRDAKFDYLERFCAFIRQRVPQITIRTVNLKDYDNEIIRIKNIYNDAWSSNWGAVPMTDAEFRLLAMNLKPGLVTDLALVVELAGEAVGVALTVPNYNQIFKKFNGRFGLREMILFALNRKRIKEARFIIMGVMKKYQKMGLEALLLLETLKNGQRLGITGGELGWTLEDNHVINNTIAKMGGKIYKKYRLYRGSMEPAN